MLAERGRRGIDSGAAMGEGEGRDRHRETTLDAVGGGMAMNDAAGLELRVGEGFAHGAHTRRRDVAGLQERLPFVGGAREHDLRQHGDLAPVIRVALVVGALDHVGAPQHGPQPALLAQVAGAQHHQPLPGPNAPLVAWGWRLPWGFGCAPLRR